MRERIIMRVRACPINKKKNNSATTKLFILRIDSIQNRLEKQQSPLTRTQAQQTINICWMCARSLSPHQHMCVPNLVVVVVVVVVFFRLIRFLFCSIYSLTHSLTFFFFHSQLSSLLLAIVVCYLPFSLSRVQLVKKQKSQAGSFVFSFSLPLSLSLSLFYFNVLFFLLSYSITLRARIFFCLDRTDQFFFLFIVETHKAQHRVGLTLTFQKKKQNTKRKRRRFVKTIETTKTARFVVVVVAGLVVAVFFFHFDNINMRTHNVSIKKKIDQKHPKNKKNNTNKQTSKKANNL